MGGKGTQSIDELFSVFSNSSVGARFYRCELHMHTPDSHDYEYKGKLFKEVSLEQIQKDASAKGLIDQDFSQRKYLDEERKRMIGFMLIAYEAYEKNIDVIAVTDHSKITGYIALKKAIKVVGKIKNYMNHITVLPGVELNSAEAVHIIGIMNPHDWKKILKFLSVVDYFQKEKRPLSFCQIAEEFKLMGGLIYYPHIHTSKITPDQKKKVYGSRFTTAVGVTKTEDIEKYENVSKTLMGERNRSVPVIIDSDAHSYEQVGRTELWLKLDIPLFENNGKTGADWAKAIRYSLRQSDRVAFESPNFPDVPRIIGLAAYNTPLGKENQWEYIRFSDQMNCLTGARGTGKSTILKLIDMMCTSKIKGKTTNEIISQRRWLEDKYERLVMFLTIPNKEQANAYAIELRPVSEDSNEERYRKYERLVNTSAIEDISKWVSLHEVSYAGLFKDVSSKKILLSTILKRIRGTSMSQSEIEDLANYPDKLYSYFCEMALNSKQFTKDYSIAIIERVNAADLLKKTIKSFKGNSSRRDKQTLIYGTPVFRRNMEALIEAYRNWHEAYNKLIEVEKKIKVKINQVLEGRSQVDYNHMPDIRDCNHVEKWLDSNNCHSDNTIESYAWSSLYFVLRENFFGGIVDLFEMTTESIIEKYPNIDEYTVESISDVIDERVAKSRKDVVELMKELIFKKLSEESFVFEKMVFHFDYLFLKHNTSVWRGYSEKNGLHERYKPMIELSLGQKCVAVMDLIIVASHFMGVDGPFRSDQPEDHQDNRYIYEHLVKTLREMKKNRQVIISTHNSNIPVGTDSEVILVMESDGDHFWPSYQGALDRNDGVDMAHQVQVVLEGGRSAFEERVHTYGYTV